MGKVIFRDRSLGPGETSHYHCTECGQDIHPDFAQSHKCNPIVKAIYKMK